MTLEFFYQVSAELLKKIYCYFYYIGMSTFPWPGKRSKIYICIMVDWWWTSRWTNFLRYSDFSCYLLFVDALCSGGGTNNVCILLYTYLVYKKIIPRYYLFTFLLTNLPRYIKMNYLWVSDLKTLFWSQTFNHE